MTSNNSPGDLEDFARDCIRADNYPECDHRYSLYRCHSCGSNSFRLTIEYHSGSEDWDFKGIIWGQCANCGYLGRLFTFTGEHRSRIKEERPECDCGNRSFTAAQCERFEGEQGIPGFFDEGVVVGKCTACGRNRRFVFTD